MSDIDNILIEHIKSPGPWLSWKWGCSKALAIGALVALIMIGLHIYPQYQAKEGETVYPIWPLGYIVFLPMTCFLIWLMLTQIYLRSGKGYKIGIAYEGNKIKQDEWKKTQDILKDLFRDNKIQKKVKLRFVPSVFSHENNKAVKFAKRYRFQILASIQESMQANPVSRKEIKIRVESKPQYDAFLKNVFPQGIPLPQKTHNKNLLELLDAHAQNLRDILLLLVGTLLFHSEKYEDAAVILRHLDKSLETIPDPSQSPRIQIRYLDMQCRLAKAHFPGKKIPTYEELNEIKQIAETTICYFDQFPDVALSVSRVRFLAGDINGAVELTKMAVDKVLNLTKNGEPVTPVIQANIYLNNAFLSYIQGYWTLFYTNFTTIMNDGSYKTINWDDLVDFVDYVHELEQYNGIVFLQAIYRIIAEQKITPQMEEAAEKWANADNSRKDLKRTLNRCLQLRKRNRKKHKRD